MADRQVTCITTSGPKDDCICISQIGRFPDLALSGRIMRSEAVRRINHGVDRFYVVDPQDNSRVWLRVVHRGVVEYLRTAPTDTARDNLLSLPEC